MSRPPGKSTRTSSASGPCRRPTATAAQAPVPPQARVSPAPRSENPQPHMIGRDDLQEPHVHATRKRA